MGRWRMLRRGRFFSGKSSVANSSGKTLVDPYFSALSAVSGQECPLHTIQITIETMGRPARLLVCGLAGGLVGMADLFRLLLQQAFQFGPSLVYQGGSELAG
jgi:hypothetical protein